MTVYRTVSKDKEHKTYKLGNKLSIVPTQTRVLLQESWVLEWV